MDITKDKTTKRSDTAYACIEGGGVTSARGFTAAGVHAGFRANPERLDMALVVADDACAAAGVFTQNVFCAAPVQFSKRQFAQASGNAGYGCARAIIINSGNANAATGSRGIDAAEEETHIVADALGCPSTEVLVASTGVIGVQLDMQPFEDGVPAAISALSVDGAHDAATAIMTTDTTSKECAVSFSGDDCGYPGATFTVGGMAKGSGMIMPNMATMIAVITTDAPVRDVYLHQALTEAVAQSFNKVTVDSDTSTNDTCFILASGRAVSPDAATSFGRSAATSDTTACENFADSGFTPGTEAFAAFKGALLKVCTDLARKMASDGEGATKLVTVHVRGAVNDEDADRAARSVANSPLVKTAIAGHDANWGRIAAALGKSGARFSQEQVDIDIMGIPVCRAGQTQPFDEDDALRRFEEPEIVIDVDLGAGTAKTTVWTCDLTHDYISINADYRS